MPRISLGAACACAMSFGLAAQAATYTVTRITLPGATGLSVRGIAPNGLYYGSFRRPNDTDTHLYTRSAAGIARYDVGPVTFISFAANGAGSFVGSEGMGAASYFFTLQAGGVLRQTFNGNPPSLIAYDDAGDWLGRSISPASGQFYGVAGHAGQGPRPLRVPGFGNTVVAAMNNSGAVIGYASHDHKPGVEGFLYASGVFSAVLGPDGGPATPNAINDNGAMVVEGDAGALAGGSFLLADGAYTRISFPNAVATYAYGLNNSNAVFGSYMDTAKVSHNFVYKAGAYTSFDLLSGHAGYLYGMDNAGNLVGMSWPNNVPKAFYVACTGDGC